MGKAALIVGEPERFNNDNLVLHSNRVTQKSKCAAALFKTPPIAGISHPLWPKREQNSSKLSI